MKRWVPISGVWLLAVSVPVAGVVDEVTSSDGIPTSAGWLVFVLAFVSVGALIVSRRPGHPIGWILLLPGVSSVLVGSSGYAADELTRLGMDQPALAVGWFSTWAWLPPSLTLDLSTQWRAYHRPGAPDLYPVALRAEMDEVMERIYRSVNNGVYRCGFAGSQDAYEEAYDQLFAGLDWLSHRLGSRRYLMGDSITEADVRLFTTLVRFDAVYHGHFKCNRQKLTEMPVLWAYARDLFQTPGFGDTVDFVQIQRHYYVVHQDINPTGIVPKGPRLEEWAQPHNRDRLGGRPFGTGSAPGPVRQDEEVPVSHNPALAPL